MTTQVATHPRTDDTRGFSDPVPRSGFRERTTRLPTRRQRDDTPGRVSRPRLRVDHSPANTLKATAHQQPDRESTTQLPTQLPTDNTRHPTPGRQRDDHSAANPRPKWQHAGKRQIEAHESTTQLPTQLRTDNTRRRAPGRRRIGPEQPTYDRRDDNARERLDEGPRELTTPLPTRRRRDDTRAGRADRTQRESIVRGPVRR